MAGLQRSTTSFRRQGSSGLVWEDRFLSGDLNQMKKRAEEEKEEENGVEFREMRRCKSGGSIGVMERNRSNGGRRYRTGKVSPAMDPPSPKVSGCGFCGVFSKPHRSKTGTRKP